MAHRVRSSLTHSALAIGGTALWGAIEFVALCRSRWGQRRRARPIVRAGY